MTTFSMPDPRAFPARDDAHPNPLIDVATQALETQQSVVQEKLDEQLVARMQALIAQGEPHEIADAITHAPSLEALRHLARQLARAHVAAGRAQSDPDLPTTVFAIPLVIVAGSASPAQLVGAVPDVNALISIMKAHGALRGNQSFVLSNSLMSAAELSLDKLPSTLSWWSAAPGVPITVPPSRMNVPAQQETAFLRFLIGTAIAAPHVDLLSARDVGKWGMPFTQEISKQLAQPNVTVLALPRAPASPLAALLVGQAAQREVAMQLFAANAIRKFRERVGEPSAVISAHRTAQGGEVRLSLSNPHDEKGAEGFRAQLFANERAQEVAQSMQALMRECGIEDVLTLAEIFPDAEPTTGLALFFKPESIADAPRLRVH